MLLERKIIKKYVFTLLVESGFFDDFGDESDQTEVLIPYYLSPEQKQELMDRYDKMGMPYVVQSNPDDQPNPDDVMDPPRSNRQIRRDVMQSADDLEARRVSQEYEDMLKQYEKEDAVSDPAEKTLPVARMKRLSHLEKAENTFNTGVIDDYEDYSYSEFSNPEGADARFHGALGSLFDYPEDTDSDDSIEQTFRFDAFKPDEDDISMPYIDSEKDGDELRESTMSRGALIRKKYYGRY